MNLKFTHVSKYKRKGRGKGRGRARGGGGGGGWYMYNGLVESSLSHEEHLCHSTFVIVVVMHTCPQAIPLAMISMRISLHGFPSGHWS